MIRSRSSITSQKESRTEDFFRLIVETSISGAFVVHDNLFRYVNPTFAELFGYETVELVNKLGPVELTHPEDRRMLMEQTRAFVREKSCERAFRIRGIRKDGRTVYLSVNVSWSTYANEPAIVGTALDITSQTELESRFQRLSEEDLTAVYEIDSLGRVIRCNDSFVSLFGFESTDEAVGSNLRALFPMPGQMDNFLGLIEDRKLIERHQSEYVGCDGKRVYVVERAIGEFDQAGNLTGIRGYIVNDTDKRELEGQLYQSQRLENLGTLVGGIAHDFNNLLAIISGHTSVLRRALDDRNKFDASIEAVRKAVSRGAQMVKQLLTFARKVDLVTQSVKVQDVVEEIVNLCKDTFSEKISFVVKNDEALPSINADPNQIHQVLLNLCVNARDAMVHGGTITISTRRVDSNGVSKQFSDVESEEYALLEVTDTGVGMDEQTISHIFEPFFTTKKNGHGTGLGLSVVYGIIKSHHGFVDVSSSLDNGSTFSVYLPIPPRPVHDTPETSESTECPAGSGETILVVEDEEPLRDFVETTLSDYGYNVIAASDGVEGARAYARNQEKISLVLMDMGLPGLSGSELLTALKGFDPQVKIIAASGYLERELKTDIFQAGALDFLPKPYSAQDLLVKIHDAIAPLTAS